MAATVHAFGLLTISGERLLSLRLVADLFACGDTRR